MDQKNQPAEDHGIDIDALDALFDAAGTWSPGAAPKDDAASKKPVAAPAAAAPARKKQDAARKGDGASVLPESDILAMTGAGAEYDDGKCIAVDPGRSKGSAPTLVPARVYAYIPLWGWLALVLGILVFAAAVIILPGISIDRLTSRLGDDSDAVAQQAMRALVVKGDERTVQKLYDMASSEEERIRARLRAVDTMSMIEDVPEVDRSLLRLQLTESTHDQVREAAGAAIRQREAAKTRVPE